MAKNAATAGQIDTLYSQWSAMCNGEAITLGSVPLELRRLARLLLSGNILDVGSRDIHIAKEAVSGKDRLNYKRYAAALAGLFKTGDLDILPTAIGIYAPWGGGKSFLLNLLLKELQTKPDANETEIWDDRKKLEWRGCMRTVLLCIWRSALVVILRIMLASLFTWWWGIFSPVVNGFWAILSPVVNRFWAILSPIVKRFWAILSPVVNGFWTILSPIVNGFRAILIREVTTRFFDLESPDDRRNDPQGNRDFIFVEFNAWECAGSDILWASLITKIFDSIEGHEQFGRGLVRVTRLRNLLLSRKWKWCGLVTFYIIVAIVGVTVVIVINVTELVAEMNAIDQWTTVLLGLPGLLTFLKAFSQLRAAGILRTTQTILQDAASKRESVGASYRGFMSEVREELEILFGVINKHNADKSNQKAYILAVIIDDLDRCPKQQIVDMLQATHLLLEQPGAPLAVFLAVDPRLIVSAVAEVLDKVPNEVTALEYLDKIIHIPFCLPRKSKRDQTNYLDALLKGEDNSCTRTLGRLRVSCTLKGVKATLGEYNEISRNLIKKVKQGPELLCALRMMRIPQTEKAIERFKSEVKSVKGLEKCERCFEKLNAKVNRVVIRQDWEAETANEAPIPTNEQRDGGIRGETLTEDQVLNAEETRILLRQDGQMETANVAPTPSSEQEDNDSGGETPSEDQVLNAEETRILLRQDGQMETANVAPMPSSEQKDNDRGGETPSEDQELNAEETRILLRQNGQMETANVAPMPSSEQKDNDSGGETPSEDQELIAEETRILLRQDGQMETANVAPTPSSEQEDNGSGGEIPSVDQGVFQHGGHTPPQQLETRLGNEEQPSRTASSVPQALPRLYVPSFTISMDEKKAFEEIFYFVDATPRKIKRVVNVYVLQRNIFLGALEQREISDIISKHLRQALVKWTFLAEFWPMRLSWVVHEMESSQDFDNETIVDPKKTITDVYGDETTEGSPCALIHGILIDKEGILGDESDMKAIYFSEATEKGFKLAVRKCKEITKELVLRPGGLLEHSFNLNPTTMTLVENIKLTLIQKSKASMGVAETKYD